MRDSGTLEECGGVAYFAQVQDAVPSAANISYYLSIVEEKYLLRKIIQACTNAVARIYEYEGDVLQLLDTVERDILKIRPQQTSTSDMKALVAEAIAKIEQKISAPHALTGLSTGLTDLDWMTDGLHKGEMVTVAALPSRGKSALATNIAVHSALRGIPSAIFTAEMRPAQLVVRSICSESHVNFRRVVEADVPQMVASAEKLSIAPLYIIQVNRWPVGQVMAAARRLHQKFHIQMGVVDYIQLLNGTGDNQEQQTSSISKGIKAICMELDIPVLALSQLNKEGETKYARAIAEDTDGLWKIENVGEWQDEIQPVNLLVEKCRDGSTGKINLTFLKTITRFVNAAKVEGTDISIIPGLKARGL
jgi:replicative DNA helicase